MDVKATEAKDAAPVAALKAALETSAGLLSEDEAVVMEALVGLSDQLVEAKTKDMRLGRGKKTFDVISLRLLDTLKRACGREDPGLLIATLSTVTGMYFHLLSTSSGLSRELWTRLPDVLDQLIGLPDAVIAYQEVSAAIALLVLNAIDDRRNPYWCVQIAVTTMLAVAQRGQLSCSRRADARPGCARAATTRASRSCSSASSRLRAWPSTLA